MKPSPKKKPAKPPPHPPLPSPSPPPSPPPSPTPIAPSSPAAETAVSVLSAIRDIQSGALHSKGLSIEDRQRCVEHLTAEGYSAAEIAEVLKIGERTILRDRKAIRVANALRVDEHFAAETVGALLRHAELTISRLRRLARDRDTPATVKVDAERVGWDVARDLVQLLQRLGHLPMAAQEIRGQLTHRLEDPPDLDSLRTELERLEGIVTECKPSTGMPEGLLARVAQTKHAVDRMAIADSIHTLSNEITTEVIANESQAE